MTVSITVEELCLKVVKSGSSAREVYVGTGEWIKGVSVSLFEKIFLLV